MEDLLAPEIFNSRGKVKKNPEEPEICPTSWSESSLDSSFEDSVPQLFLAVKKGMSPSLAARLTMPALRTGKQLTQHLVYIINHGLANNQVEVSLNLSVQFKAHPKFVSSLLYALSMVTKSPSRHLAQLLVSFLQTPDLGELGGRLESQVSDILISWLGFSGDPGVGPSLTKDCRWLVEETGDRLLQEASSGFQMVFQQVKSSLISGVGGASVRAELVELLVIMSRQAQQSKLREVKYGVDVVEDGDVNNTDKAETPFVNEYKEKEETYQEFVDSKESDNEVKVTKVNFEEDKGVETPSLLSEAHGGGAKDECKTSENVGEGNVVSADDYRFNETEEIELDNYEPFAVPDEENSDDLISMKTLMFNEIEADKGELRLLTNASIMPEVNLYPLKSCQKELPQSEPEHLRTEPDKEEPAVAGPRILGRLVSTKSQGEKMSFAVEENWLLGRSRDCQVYIPRKEVSKVHAAIRVVEGQIVIEANSDTNPLKVNKEVVAKGSMKILSDGDLVKIGKEELEWIVQNDEQDDNSEKSLKDESKYSSQDHSVLFHSVLEDSASP